MYGTRVDQIFLYQTMVVRECMVYVLEAYNKAYNKNRQHGNRFDIQKWIAKTGIEFHPPG